MAPRWNDEMNIKFIRMYREHECLWDQLNQLYTNKYARESALTEIAGEMNIEGFGASEANRKIKALRATYHSEMKKHLTSKKSGCSPENVYTSPLKWFGEMRQIIAMGTLKRKHLNSEEPIKLSQRRQDWEDEDEVALGHVDEIDEDPLADQGRDEEPYQPQTTPAINHFVTNDITPIKRLKLQPKLPMPQVAAAPARELRHPPSQSDSTPEVRENEFDIFGKHVASQLKQLKAEHAVTAIGEISNILTQKRLSSLFGNVNPNNCGPTSSYSNSEDILSPITIITSDDTGQVNTEH